MNSIICLGNILMGDDAIGIVLGHLLMKKKTDYKVFIIETDMNLLYKIIQRSNKIILIDAADLEINPGYYKILPLNEINYNNYSSHGLIYNFRNCNGYFFGIQIKSIKLNLGLSPEISNNIKIYMNELLKIL